MFEDEIKMEEESGSNWVPYLALAALAIIVIGSIAYFVHITHQKPSTNDAASAVSTWFKGPVTTTFKTGKIAYSQSENIANPNYKLLQKMGVLTIAKGKNGDGTATLTPAGDKLLASFSGVKKETNRDGSASYTVPLASRKLVKIESIEKITAGHFKTTFSWKWETNTLGDTFDIASIQKSGYTAWEKQFLIDKCGATFFHRDQEKVTVTLIKGDKGWQIQQE